MGMYVRAAPLANTRDLNQGDILAAVPWIQDGRDNDLILLNGSPGNRDKTYTIPPPEVDQKRFGESVRAAQMIKRADFALVVSNSCDNTEGSSSLELAPIRPFVLPQGATEDAQWEKISFAATSTNNPKVFYLPADGEFGLTRSKALLGDRFYISHKLLGNYVRKVETRLVCSLSAEAIRHLQWQLSMIYCRNPREDPDADRPRRGRGYGVREGASGAPAAVSADQSAGISVGRRQCCHCCHCCLE